MSPHDADNGASQQEFGRLAREVAREVVRERESFHVDRVKFAAKVLTIVVVVITGAGLIGGADVVRVLHNEMFPPMTPDRIAYSYQASFTLRWSDPGSRSAALTFYATEAQAVETYAEFGYPPWDKGERRKVSIQLNGNTVAPPSTNDVCVDLTDDLEQKHGLRNASDNRFFSLVKNMHTLAFHLADVQSGELADEVYVVCIINVYEMK